MCNWSTHFPKMCDKLYIYIYIPHRRNEEQSPAAAAASHQTALPLLPLLALPLPALPLPAAPPLTARPLPAAPPLTALPLPALPLPTLPLGAPTGSPLPPAAGASSLLEKKLRMEMRVLKRQRKVLKAKERLIKMKTEYYCLKMEKLKENKCFELHKCVLTDLCQGVYLKCVFTK